MNNKELVSVIIFFGLLMSSCGDDEKPIRELPPRDIREISSDMAKRYELAEDTIWNQLIVRYDDKWSPQQIDSIKADLSDRYSFKIAAQKCSCGNEKIELLTFNNQVDLEGAIGTMEKSEGGGEGDLQTIFSLPDAKSYEIPKPSDLGMKPYIQLVLDQSPNSTIPNNRINIAVIDTGVDLFNISGVPPYLYNTRYEKGLKCPDEISGWNFVGDGNYNVEAEQEHGPVVNGIIRSQLEDQIPFSILPVKAFDKNGISTYWDMVCAMSYIKEIQEKNGDIHFVNASFGYDFSDYSQEERDSLQSGQSILKKLIKELGELSIIVVTSSGNEGNDNNQPQYYHYPSGFNFTGPPPNVRINDSAKYKTNIVGVGGFSGQDNLIQTEGNYGSHSIDLSARFGIYSIVIKHSDSGQIYQQTLNAEGTSFGTAFTTATLAKYLENSSNGGSIDLGTPWKFKTSFFNSNLISRNSDLNFVTRIKEGKILN